MHRDIPQRGSMVWHDIYPTVVSITTNSIVVEAGTFTSPAGAYPSVPAATSRATFAFATAYPPGATSLVGTATFHLQRPNFRFHATTLDSLTVVGNFITIQGRGRVNNAGDYKFRISALDVSPPGGNPPDRFRIRIWERTTGTLVYDNEWQREEGALSTTPIATGIILIHP